MPPALPWILLAYALLSLVAIVLYGFDKRRARQNGRRVSERTLHAVALLGGWPGAMWARQHFRHKTLKRVFGVMLVLSAALHVGLWTWFLLSRRGV